MYHRLGDCRRRPGLHGLWLLLQPQSVCDVSMGHRDRAAGSRRAAGGRHGRRHGVEGRGPGHVRRGLSLCARTCPLLLLLLLLL